MIYSSLLFCRVNYPTNKTTFEKRASGFEIRTGIELRKTLSANFETNGCIMTYMYEYPEYEPIKLTEVARQRFPKYRLYVYGEGKYSQKHKDGKFSGIPVLYIPGNSGSYKQVRSMGSVALRKAEDQNQYKLHFDYFAVDFNEEFSAIYGGVLEDQTLFVSHCVPTKSSCSATLSEDSSPRLSLPIPNSTRTKSTPS